ncbi:hypothetical protein [Streptomyces sp.]|uniref:hypothetical protein n=1 Tax=Streptomyces sp. TaxID=1931 RepID=UPI002F951F84
MKVRYQTYAGTTDWITCESAAVEGEVLRIVHETRRAKPSYAASYPPLRETYVPLALIVGAIEVEDGEGL